MILHTRHTQKSWIRQKEVMFIKPLPCTSLLQSEASKLFVGRLILELRKHNLCSRRQISRLYWNADLGCAKPVKMQCFVLLWSSGLWMTVCPDMWFTQAPHLFFSKQETFVRWLYVFVFPNWFHGFVYIFSNCYLHNLFLRLIIIYLKYCSSSSTVAKHMDGKLTSSFFLQNLYTHIYI